MRWKKQERWAVDIDNGSWIGEISEEAGGDEDLDTGRKEEKGQTAGVAAVSRRVSGRLPSRQLGAGRKQLDYLFFCEHLNDKVKFVQISSIPH